jgi:phage gp36-like protein
MSYFTRAQIEAEIPPADLVALLDDNHDGSEDSGLFTSLAARAEARVDAILARRYDLPFAIVPPMVTEAAILSLCASLYRRRGSKDSENPFAERETEALDYLRKVAGGDADLTPASAGGKSKIIGEGNQPADDLHWAVPNQEGM